MDHLRNYYALSSPPQHIRRVRENHCFRNNSLNINSMLLHMIRNTYHSNN